MLPDDVVIGEMSFGDNELSAFDDSGALYVTHGEGGEGHAELAETSMLRRRRPLAGK